jgi:dTDP-4-dehydrorhamnose reductase
VKILVFGAGGQVGREVCRAAWPTSSDVLALDRNASDVTRPAEVSAVIAREKPDLAINLAAYTTVDQAEGEPETAWAVNCAGAANIAAACGESTTALIHLSTDYVFDGSKTGPYQEDDEVNPLSVYGRSKEAGERAVRAGTARHVILRTAWVYGAQGTNFVKTMLRLGVAQPVLRVVADQHGCPTAAPDIASALIVIAGAIERGKAEWGTFHFSGAGTTSWHRFAEEIIDVATRLGAWSIESKPRVEPITTDQYPTAARRPLNSVLDCRKIARSFGISAPPWRTSLRPVVRELLHRTGRATCRSNDLAVSEFVEDHLRNDLR